MTYRLSVMLGKRNSIRKQHKLLVLASQRQVEYG